MSEPATTTVRGNNGRRYMFRIIRHGDIWGHNDNKVWREIPDIVGVDLWDTTIEDFNTGLDSWGSWTGRAWYAEDVLRGRSAPNDIISRESMDYIREWLRRELRN